MSRRHIRAGQGRKQKGHSPCNREWPGTCGLGLGGGGFGGAAARTLEEGAHVGKQHVHSRHAAARKLHGAVDFQRSRHDVAGERHHGVVQGVGKLGHLLLDGLQSVQKLHVAAELLLVEGARQDLTVVFDHAVSFLQKWLVAVGSLEETFDLLRGEVDQESESGSDLAHLVEDVVAVAGQKSARDHVLFRHE